MSTLDIKYKRRAFGYFIATCFCVLINYIYGLFSHGVHSNYMTYMFLFPLVAVILCMIFKHRCLLYYETLIACIATFTMGCFISGVLEIAGTSFVYTKFYWIVGGVLLGINLVVLIRNIRQTFHQ